MPQVERAVFDLRRGLPVVIEGADEPCLVAAVEALDDDLLAEMRHGASAPGQLLLTGYRLSHLGLPDAPEVAAIALQASDTSADIVRWALAAAADLPLQHSITPATRTQRSAVLLARRGRLIPALVAIVPTVAYAHRLREAVDANDILQVRAADIRRHHDANHGVRQVSAARVPLAAGRESRFVIFRETGSEQEPVAVLIGDRAQWQDPIPVRVHSSCLTGDLFGSLRCDCGSQLRASVAELGRRGGGVLLYLPQRGRGIGLANKMRTYQRQDDGLDTIDANHALGFNADERDYATAREILIQLDVLRINLLTNNPVKLEAMNRAPIEVCNRSSIYGQLTDENRRLLLTKARRAGHWLAPMLDEPPADGQTQSTGNKR